jgi:hypothetical protein
MSYAIGTLAAQRTKIFDRWLEHVKAQIQAPAEVIVASEHPFPEDPAYTMVPFNPHIPPYLEPGSYGEKLIRIGEGREAVRSYVCDKGYTWLLFVDSDVYIPPDTFPVMNEVARRADVGLVQNLIRGSGDVYFGCVLIHRDILRRVHFFSLAYSGSDWLSEDWIFFSELGFWNFWQPGRFKWVRQAVVPLIHDHGPGDQREPLPIDLSRLQILTI